MLKLLSWNIRGLGRQEKRGMIRKILKERKIDIVLFQETKKAVESDDVVRSIWARDKMECIAINPNGLAGGLLCIWDPGVFQLVDCCSNRNFVLLSGTLFCTFECAIINIYAPNDVGARGKLWDSLILLRRDFPKPWCLGGDFNEIRNMGERRGCSRRDRGMRDLNNFIDRCEVSDLNLLGRKFTWCNGNDGGKWSRIDRFMVHPEWLEHFKVKLWGLPSIISDHCALLLMEDKRDWGPRPFRFINAWTKHPDFSPFVKKVWNETNVVGWAGYKLQVKLKSLKLALKQWNLEVFGNVHTKLKQAEVELPAFDLEAENRKLDEVEKRRRAEVREEFWKLSTMVDRLWLQKSRLNWLLYGDKNTRFLHVMANCR